MIPKTITYKALKHLIPPRDKAAHKGDFGHILVVGGDHGYGGAAIMAAEAAARTGAGLVSVATHPEHIPSILARSPELMSKGIESAEELNALIPLASVIVIGPGLGKTEWSKLCLQLVLDAQSISKIPLVLDADALNLISQGVGENFTPDATNWIITPHPGEAARLLSSSRNEVQSNRLQAIEKLQTLFGGATILKGEGSLISFNHNEKNSEKISIERCGNGNPGMATGGMGDVLSGIIGGLLAQHFSLKDSARLGVCLHGESADRVAAMNGQRGMLATDLLPFIQRLMNP